MKRFYGIIGLLFSGYVVFLTIGCGGGLDTQMAQLRTGIDSLKEAGAPDSAITDLEVAVFQFQDERKRGRKADAKKTLANGLALLASTKANLSEALQNASGQLDSLKTAIREKAPELTGVRAEAVRQGVLEVDSLMQANRFLMAKDKAVLLANALPVLLQNEQDAKEIAPKILGTWERVTAEKDAANKVDYLEKEKYSFGRDLSFTIEESKKGAQGENLYFDYQFVSTGHYTLNGDSVKMGVKRLKGYNRNKVRNPAKNEWVKVDAPPFDSLVTNGSEDRFQTYPDLKQHFKKK